MTGPSGGAAKSAEAEPEAASRPGKDSTAPDVEAGTEALEGDEVFFEVFETVSESAVLQPRDVFNGPRDLRWGPTPGRDGLTPVELM